MIYPANLNLSITAAARAMSATAETRKNTVAKMASGSKLETSRTDTAAVGVALKFKSEGVVAGALQANMSEALSFLGAQADGLKQLGKYLDRMGELVSQMGDPTKTETDQASYMEEFNKLREGVLSVQGAQFNGLDLFYSQGDSAALTVQLSASNSSATMELKQTNLSQQAGWVALLGFSEPFTGLAGVSDTPANLVDPNALGGASFFEGMTQEVAQLISENGSQQGQLKLALEHSRQAGVSRDSAQSRIEDVDVAKELAHLTRSDILMQSGSAMMTQANVAAQSVLKLYGV
jgi:flagellin